MKNKSQRGFTLIELLVVIAIIAVLASLSFVGLQNARRRGNDVAALGQMNAILAQAQICADTSGVTALGIPATTNAICTGSNNYPSLPTGWAYTATYDIDVTDGDYSYQASSSIPAAKTITCTEGGCSKSGF